MHILLILGMRVYDLIQKRRTIRKFKSKPISKKILLDCLNAARLAPSSRNDQPLEYVLVTQNLDAVFLCTQWAGYLDDGAPKANERPMAYIVVVSNPVINDHPQYDVGLAAAHIVLTAFDRGVASCIMASVDKMQLAKNLRIPNSIAIELVIALGYPKQQSVAAPWRGNTRYWLDKKEVVHVPKRALAGIVHEEKF